MKFLRRSRKPAEVPAPPAHPVGAVTYATLRASAIRRDPTTIGIHPTPDLPTVWGIVMDWALDRGVATIVSLADGSTSMYLESGGGVIGAGEHQAPAAASISAVRTAERMVADFPAAQDAPSPGLMRTALTLMTFAGLRRIEEDTSAFADGTSRFSPVWNAMQQVIHEISRIENVPKGSG